MMAAKLVLQPRTQDVLGQLWAQEARSPWTAHEQAVRHAMYFALPLTEEYDRLRAALTVDAPPVLTMRVGATMPTVEPLISKEVQAQVEQMLVEARDPQAAAEVRELHIIVNTLRGLVATFRAGLDRVCPGRTPLTTGAA